MAAALQLMNSNIAPAGADLSSVSHNHSQPPIKKHVGEFMFTAFSLSSSLGATA
jgi:hypothetical protein